MDPKIAKLDNDYRELEGKLAAGGLSALELKELAVRHSQLAPMMAKVRELLRVESGSSRALRRSRPIRI